MPRIFGIDLGTTNSLIAASDNGTPRVLAVGDNGGALVPSVVAISP
ncbi:MAG TPA: Hsp70 family protein, partial [Patescibacteria group bacterium]|nr:Hsp70 family protein [Patescibacteria group bacterium]